MANEGATFYYSSKQLFDFQQACLFLENHHLSIRSPDTQLISCINGSSEFIETNQENIQEIIYNSQNAGVYLYLESGHRLFWSFVAQSNYFYQSFGFNYLDYLQIEEMVSKIFTKFALEELIKIDEGFLGFTLDQFGTTDAYDFGEIFDQGNREILSSFYISDITFLPKDKINRITLDDESKIIQLNENFDCIAKNKDLADYLKSLLGKK
ncbi:hypothetical protein NIES4102_27010 [Chondrocystis sp. NIES-4102]|nr:hypothetical protein NIES4102_27010 [Chondrocystis sp. NIES-4102]